MPSSFEKCVSTARQKLLISAASCAASKCCGFQQDALEEISALLLVGEWGGNYLKIKKPVFCQEQIHYESA